MMIIFEQIMVVLIILNLFKVVFVKLILGKTLDKNVIILLLIFLDKWMIFFQAKIEQRHNVCSHHNFRLSERFFF